MKRSKPLRKTAFKRKPKKALSLNEIKDRFAVVTAAMLGEKPRKPMRKRAKNNRGWIDVAREIWDDPNNDRRCEVCEEPLGDVFHRGFYHHILHRGSYRRFIRRKDNLAQLCPACHDKAHEHTIEGMVNKGDDNPHGWRALWLRFRRLRDEAHGISDHT